MKGRSSHMLGLAISDRSILCAQASGSGSRVMVEKLARFEAVSAEAWTKPTESGAALGTFLREHGFTATRAVWGVPAKWLVAQERELPPSNSEQATAMLRLAVERMAVTDNADLVFDAAGEAGGAAAHKVMVVGLLRQQLERVLQLSAAARVTVVAVTATPLVMAATGTDGPVVMLAEHGIEVVTRRGGAVRAVRHLPTIAGTKDVALDRLSGEVLRAVSLGGDGSGGTLWDGVGLSGVTRSALAEHAGLDTADAPSIERLGAQVQPGALNGHRGPAGEQAFVPAAALATAGLRHTEFPVDFTRSRLTPPPKRRLTRQRGLAIAAAAAVVIGLISLFLTVQQREGEAATFEDQVKRMAPDIKAAQAVIDRVNYGRSYFETRTPVLACLRELTLAIGADEPVWITSFTLRDTRRGQVQGRAADQRVVLMVLDRLKANASFSQVQLQDMREGTGRSRDIAFAIAFAFVGTEVSP